jgi:hypothetical protein
MANNPAFAYNFQNSVLTINGIRIGAFDEGDAVIKITPSADLATVTTGSCGAKTFNVSADRGCIIEITLQKLSPSNNVLRQIANAYQVPGILVTALSCSLIDIVNRNRTVATKGMITKLPAPEHGGKAGKQTWVMEFAEHEITEANATQLGSI